MRGLYPQYLFARVFDVVATYLLQVISSDSGIVEENHITVVAWNVLATSPFSFYTYIYMTKKLKVSYIYIFRI